MNTLFSLVKHPGGWHVAIADNGRLSHVIQNADVELLAQRIEDLLLKLDKQAATGAAIDVTVIFQAGE